MRKITIEVDEYELDEQSIEQLIKKAVVSEFLDENRDSIKVYVKEAVKNETIKALSGEIQIAVKNAVEMFVKEGMIFNNTNRYSDEKVKFEQYFKSLLQSKQFSIGKDDMVMESSGAHAHRLIDLFTIEHLTKLVNSTFHQWVEIIGENVKANIAVIVQNNIQKELFGKALPDKDLLKIAVPKDPNAPVENDDELPY